LEVLVGKVQVMLTITHEIGRNLFGNFARKVANLLAHYVIDSNGIPIILILSVSRTLVMLILSAVLDCSVPSGK
jgi:hypothetical protein